VTFEGMNVDAVRSAHQQMSSLHQQLQTIVGSMPHILSELESAWQGPDAKQFAAQWPSHQAQLQSALTGLQEICTHIQANLQQQEQTSSSYV
jgi:WXG100 family type VII secretion target